MNKSKFLKKSLAMLLALMLVFAMIPLSASAAEAPIVDKITVNGVEVNLESLSAEITDPAGDDVSVTVQLLNGNGSVAHYTGLQDDNSISSGKGVWTFKLTDEEVAKGSFEFYTVDTAGQKSEPYIVTFTTTPRDADTSVESVVLNNGKMYAVWSDTNGATTDYTIIAPYGYDIAKGSVTVTPAADTSKVFTGTDNEETDGVVDVTSYYSKVGFKVQAQNGEEESYTITIVEPVPFATFAIEDERRESQIERVTEDPTWAITGKVTKPRVEVYVPYGEKIDDNGDYFFTPEFTTNYDVKVVAVKNDTAKTEVELVSGETYNLKDLARTSIGTAGNALQDKAINLKVYYSDSDFEEWTLFFDTIQQDTVAAIKGLMVDNYVADIDETTTPPTITLTIPASVRGTKELELNVSKGMKVDLVDSTETMTASKDGFSTWTWDSNDLKKDSYTLRVTAPAIEVGAEKAQVKDYRLVVENAQVQEPKLNSIKLQSETTGEKAIEGEINGHTIVFNGIPYRYKNVGDMADADWQLFWNATSGAKVTYKNGTAEEPIAVSGEVVSDAWTYLPDPDKTSGKRFVNAKADATIDVTIDNKTVSYEVYFNSKDANKESALGDVWLAHNKVTKLDELNSGNHTKAIVSGNTITADIYYNEWRDYTAGTANNWGGPKVNTTLPEGAKIYFVNQIGANYGKLVAIDLLGDEAFTGVTLPSVGYQFGGTPYYNYGNTWNDSTKNWNNNASPLQIVVVSEAAVEQVTANTTLTDIKTDSEFDGLASVYGLTLKQKEPRHQRDLTSFSVYDDYTGTTVNARIDGDQIYLTLPAYFVDAKRKSIDNLYLNYGPADGGQTVTVDSTTGTELKWLKTKDDGSYDLSTTYATKLTWNTANGLMVNNDDLNAIQVTAEDGEKRANPYKLNVTIAEANTEAVLNSVSYGTSSARPNADREVTLTVPFSTEVTSMALDFDISENAYVLEGKWEVADLSALEADKEPIVDEDETFNFLQTRTFTVVSEDNKETEIYTITVVPSETFNDVTTDKWYYDEVMTAANKGWINGTKPGYFEPEADMTRGQFVTIVARIMNYDESAYSKSAFPDVDSDIYYSAAAAFCKEQNIIDGDDKGNFNGEDPITREEMAKIMCQALQLKVTIPEKTYADDVEIAQWAKGYVYACQEAGIMEGSGDNFNPRDNATRAEGAAVLVRAFA